ncbi:hypothetical protein [Microbacterium sp.]|uniref:hypothetical protein n=1 Tax=Microbacterium sp. TaxID=51671 RepID=UPI003A887171
MAKPQLLDLFHTLSPPAPGTLRGEYAGIDYFGRTEDTIEAALTRLRSGDTFWLGKAFPGVEGDGASGDNRIHNPDGTVSRRDRYGIHRGTSPLDGNPTILLKYSDFDNAAGGIGFLDEVRQVNERLFVCTGTPEEGKGDTGSFFMSGPPAPFVGPDDPTSELLS